MKTNPKNSLFSKMSLLVAASIQSLVVFCPLQGRRANFIVAEPQGQGNTADELP
jgi:hypothetical protein